MLFWIALAVIAIGSLVTLVLYGTDKSRARRGAWRIPERVLLLSALLVGAPGGLLGMYLFRHKTRHFYFHVVNFLGLVWQAAALALLFRHCFL